MQANASLTRGTLADRRSARSARGPGEPPRCCRDARALARELTPGFSAVKGPPILLLLAEKSTPPRRPRGRGPQPRGTRVGLHAAHTGRDPGGARTLGGPCVHRVGLASRWIRFAEPATRVRGAAPLHPRPGPATGRRGRALHGAPVAAGTGGRQRTRAAAACAARHAPRAAHPGPLLSRRVGVLRVRRGGGCGAAAAAHAVDPPRASPGPP